MGGGLRNTAGGSSRLVVLALAITLCTCSTQPTLEIKTEAPPPRPDALVMPKDCQVYDGYGVLQEVRKHGEQWLNDGSDCEFCKCTDGEKRCFYHYCNAGLITGYMTPPSVLGPGGKKTEQPPAGLPLDDEDHIEEEEGSGAQPWPDDYYKVIQEALEHDLDLATSSRRGKVSGEKKKIKNAQDNETHDIGPRPDLCGKPCKKSCPLGYKIDSVTGCRRCKCLNCQPLKHCLLKCPDGFALDSYGCKTCQCYMKSSGEPVVITTSLDGDDFIVEEGYGMSKDGSDKVTDHGGIYITADEGMISSSVDSKDPSCNDTRIEGCSDGHRFFTVGSRFERGPCVSCMCVATGYTECNVTRCAPLPCPSHQQIKLEDYCCPICEDTTKTQIIRDYAHESRSTSRVPLDRMPPTRPHDVEHDISAKDSAHRMDTPSEDDSTTKSAVQATGEEWSQIVVIVIPILVIFTLVGTLIVHFWRRYHRDKYDINAYRPEETEKLRPVKTVDDNHHVRHV